MLMQRHSMTDSHRRAPKRRPSGMLTAALVAALAITCFPGCRMMNGTEFSAPTLPTPVTATFRDGVLLRGQSPEYPLPMASITASYEWLDRLTDLLGGPITYERVRSLKKPTDPGKPVSATVPPHGLRSLLSRLSGNHPSGAHIIDCYRLTDRYGNERLIYLDPYAGHTAPDAPEGLRLRPPHK